MSNQNLSSSFPATQRDLSNLKQTATDAAADLSSTVTTHASKASGQVRELAGHAQEEGAQQFNQLKGKFADILAATRDYTSQRPLACIGVALAVGFLFGLSRGRSCGS